jgi:hypothetical protein
MSLAGLGQSWYLAQPQFVGEANNMSQPKSKRMLLGRKPIQSEIKRLERNVQILCGMALGVLAGLFVALLAYLASCDVFP